MLVIVEKFERLLTAVDSVLKWTVASALLLMTAVLFFNSIGRSVFNVSFVGGPALGRLLIIWLTFLGSYLAVRRGSHVTVDILQRLLPETAIRKMGIPVGLLSAVTTAYIGWLGATFTWTRFAAGQTDPMLLIPSGFFYLPVPIGCFLMTLAFLQVALRCLTNAPGGAAVTLGSRSGAL